MTADGLFQHPERVDFPQRRRSMTGYGRAWRQEAVLAGRDARQSDHVGALRNLLALKRHQIPRCSAGNVHNAPGDSAKLARLLLIAEPQQLILGDSDAFGGVDQELQWSPHGIGTMRAVEAAVHLPLDDSSRTDTLENTAGLPVHNFRLHVGPLGPLFVVDADFVD